MNVTGMSSTHGVIQMRITRLRVTQMMFITNDGNKNEGKTNEANKDEGHANKSNTTRMKLGLHILEGNLDEYHKKVQYKLE